MNNDTLSPRHHLDRLAVFAVLFGATAISFAPLFVRWSYVDGTATAFWRLALAWPVFALLSHHQRNDRPVRPANARWWWPYVPGVLFGINTTIWAWSILYSTIANATLIPNLAPIPVTIVAWYLFGEKFRPIFFVGMACAVLGTTMLLGESLSLGGTYLRGDLLAVVSCFTYSSYLLSLRIFRSYYSTAHLMTCSCFSGTVSVLIVAIVMDTDLFWTATPFLLGLAPLLAVAWLSQVGGQGAIAYAFAHLPAGFAALSLLLQPVVSTIAAWFLLGEHLTPLQIAGAAVVLSGIALARWASLSPAPREEKLTPCPKS